MKSFFKFIIAFPKSIIFSFAILLLIFGYFATKLEIDASSQTLLLQNNKNYEIWREVDKRYQTPNFLVLAYTPKDELLSKSSLETIAALKKEIESLDFVDNTLSILNVPLFLNKKFKLDELLREIPTLQDGNADLKKAKEEFLTNPFYASNLVSKDFKTTAIVINLKPNLKYESFLDRQQALHKKIANDTISSDEKRELKELEKEFKIYRDENREIEKNNIEELRKVVAMHKGSGELFLGGVNMIANDMISFIRNDIVFYGFFSSLLLMFCLWLFFREMRFVLLPLFVCVTSAILASGLFGLLDIEVTVISSNFVALQIVITMSIVIHLIVAYRERVLKHPLYSQSQLVYLSLKDRLFPCFFAIFTTVIGFFSLVLSDIKPIIMLGVMMSVGISISLIVAYMLFGASMVLLKKRAIKTSFEDSFKFTIWCAKLAINKRALIYSVAASVVVVGLFGISKLEVENSFIGYFKKSTEIYKGMAKIDKELGGTVPVDVIVKFKDEKRTSSEPLDEFESEFASLEQGDEYWFSSKKIRVIKEVHNYLSNKDFVGYVGSFENVLAIGKEINGGVELDDFMLSVFYKELPDEYRKIVLNPYINIAVNEAHFVVRTVDSDKNLKRNEFLKSLSSELNELLKDEDVEVTISGIMVLYNDMLQALFSSQIETLGFVILTIFVLFIFIFKSVKFAFIAIVVNVIPLSFVFAVMGIFAIPLDIMSITIAAISIGIGIDDSIHYIYRYKMERKRAGVEEAIMRSHGSIGYAMYYTSFAIFLGFCVMTISNFWPTIYFGLLIDLVMALMLISALILLPALIISFSKKREN